MKPLLPLSQGLWQLWRLPTSAGGIWAWHSQWPIRWNIYKLLRAGSVHRKPFLSSWQQSWYFHSHISPHPRADRFDIRGMSCCVRYFSCYEFTAFLRQDWSCIVPYRPCMEPGHSSIVKGTFFFPPSIYYDAAKHEPAHSMMQPKRNIQLHRKKRTWFSTGE